MYQTITTSAPAKLILCGEHAVVYGRPAIALPLAGIRARVALSDGPPSSGVVVEARDLQRRWALGDTPDDPLSQLAADLLARFGLGTDPDLLLTIESDIPIASGMGSGAAVASALVRALARRFGHEPTPAQVSDLVFQSERRLHGTPSGIDNTVIAFEQPIWFVRAAPNRASSDILNTSDQTDNTAPGTQHATLNTQNSIAPLAIGASFRLLVGDTGVRSATHEPVGAVRRGWQADPARYEALFDAVAGVAGRVRALLAAGDVAALGPLLDENHALLQQIGVSSPELDRLVVAARGGGALGAKLSGAGWGGVMLALVTEQTSAAVGQALREAGAVRVLETEVGAG
ncbi:MAG TPA: mevalonate kinase [Roseiflexaceae bacterium]|nr:mevalonate kinase [Roseiflexaceae bacterium]